MSVFSYFAHSLHNFLFRLHTHKGFKLTRIIIRRDRHVTTINYPRPVLMPIEPIIDVVCSARLFFRTPRPDTSWSVSRSRLDADSSIKRKSNNGDVKGTVMFQVEASLPG